MATPTDLGKLVDDLHKKHPRLVVLFTEYHSCMQGKKLITPIAAKSGVMFHEEANPNPGKYPTGSAMHPDILLAEKQFTASNHPDDPDRIKNELRAAAPVNLRIDEPEEKRVRLTMAQGALNEHIAQGTTLENPVYKKLMDEFQAQKIERIKDSNAVMAKTIANYLDTAYPNNAPFLATGWVGAAHINRVESYGLKDSESDIRTVLEKRGYETVIIDIEPIAPSRPADAPGSYKIEIPAKDKLCDYKVKIVDPTAAAKLAQERAADPTMPR